MLRLGWKCFCKRVSAFVIFSLSHNILFYVILHDSIAFYSILFDTILFYSILFYSILFHSILFHSIPYYSIPFYSMPDYCIVYYHTSDWECGSTSPWVLHMTNWEAQFSTGINWEINGNIFRRYKVIEEEEGLHVFGGIVTSYETVMILFCP